MLFILRVYYTQARIRSPIIERAITRVTVYAVECHCISSDARAARYMQRASQRARRSILRPEAACPPSNYLAKKKEAEVKTYVIDPGSFGFLRLTALVSSFFRARGRAGNRTPRHFCQKCIVHSVCNLRPSPSPSPRHRHRHRHLHCRRIASYRIA